MFNLLSRLNNLGRLFQACKARNSLQKSQEVFSSDKDVLDVTNSIRLTIEGMPKTISQDEYQQVVCRLTSNVINSIPQRSYKKGDNIYEGRSRLKVNDDTFEIKFSLDATRVMSALMIYKSAFDKVNEGAYLGIYDQDLAQDAATYFKKSAWEEVQSIEHSDPISPSYKEGKENKSSDDFINTVDVQNEEIVGDKSIREVESCLDTEHIGYLDTVDNSISSSDESLENSMTVVRKKQK